jgi:hypothetical protein
MSKTPTWFGFEGEDFEGSCPAEYEVAADQMEMSPEDEAAHGELVRRVANEFGFPVPSWTPTIPSRDLT